MNFSLEWFIPLLLAALGALYSQRAGVLNIALEGQILGGAFAAIIVQNATNQPWLALAAAGAVGILTSLLLAWGVLRLQANLYIAALGLNLLIPALVGGISQVFYGNQGAIRLLRPLDPNGLPWMLLLAFLITLVTAQLLNQSVWGLRLRATGQNPSLLQSRGIQPQPLQTQALVLSGLLAAWGGFALALSLGVFVPGMSAGKGWLALIALYLGLQRPWGIVLACAFLATVEQMANHLQAMTSIPPGFVQAIPSIIALVVFVVVSALTTRAKRGESPPRSKR